MKKSIRMRFSLILLSLLLIFSLSACGTNGENATAEKDDEQKTEESSALESDEASITESKETDNLEHPTDFDTKESDEALETNPLEDSTNLGTTETEPRETEKDSDTETEENNVFDLVDFTVSVPADREPVILQLTDTQIIDAAQNDRLGASALNFWGPEHKSVECYDYITEIIDATKPDLILLTGDLVYGEFDNNGTSFSSLVEFMDSFDIPWAPIFGNHEAESKMGIDWQCALLEKAENCLFLQRDLTGNGNYTVGIEQGGRLTRVFFMLDSNGCGAASEESLANTHFKASSGFGNDQISWYKERANNIKRLSPETNLSFAFHIQLKAIVDSFEIYAEESNATHIDLLDNTHEGDFGYISENRDFGWDHGYTVWNGLSELGVDSIFVGHVHTHSASIVYEGIRVQFGMKSSTYDKINYVDQNGNIKNGYHLGGLTPLVGGTVTKLSTDGAINGGYIYYCKNAGGEIDWDSFKPDNEDMCTHTDNTSEWIFDETDPQHESSICSVCGEAASRPIDSTPEGLLIFNYQHIKNKAGGNADIMHDGPGEMSYVRINSTKTSGNEFVLLYSDKNNARTDLGNYVAILYRTSVDQRLMFACDSTSSVQNGGVQKPNTYKSADQWSFVVHENPTHKYYDGEKLTAFAFYQFAAGIDRTLEDYTDIAFIGFFSSAEEAWEYFDLYREAYGFLPGINLTSQYYVHLNGGDTMIDGNRVISIGSANASVNKAHSFDCASMPLTTADSSLKIYGWCATPGGVKAYGYYVVDKTTGSRSDFVLSSSGKDSTATAILSQFASYQYPSSSRKGLLMGETNPISIDLAGYDGKTVDVVFVAITNWGGEICLANFNNVTVPKS